MPDLWLSLFPIILAALGSKIWIDDHLRFQVKALGESASGSIGVAEDHVRLEVLLPWLLAKLVGTIQPLIRKEGTLLIEKNNASAWNDT
jgi:hypothetical protein